MCTQKSLNRNQVDSQPGLQDHVTVSRGHRLQVSPLRPTGKRAAFTAGPVG